MTEDNDVAHTNLGVALEQQGKLNEALAEYRKAERLAPERYQVHNNLGNLLANMGKSKEALAEYQEALRITQMTRRRTTILALCSLVWANTTRPWCNTPRRSGWIQMTGTLPI